MNAEEFRKRGRQMIDYVADYLENIRQRRPLSNVEPGYLSKLIPERAPEEGEEWDDLFKDIERVIMPGVNTTVPGKVMLNWPRGGLRATFCAPV